MQGVPDAIIVLLVFVVTDVVQAWLCEVKVTFSSLLHLHLTLSFVDIEVMPIRTKRTARAANSHMLSPCFRAFADSEVGASAY